MVSWPTLAEGTTLAEGRYTLTNAMQCNEMLTLPLVYGRVNLALVNLFLPCHRVAP
jgi:hypothetical protein